MSITKVSRHLQLGVATSIVYMDHACGGYQTYAQQQSMQSQLQEIQNTRDELEQRWGAATAEKLDLAKQAAQAIYGDGLNDAMNTEGPKGAIGNNPAMLEILAQLGQARQGLHGRTP